MEMTLRTGSVHTGQVEGYTSEGQGVVRVDGAVVFVPGAVRGETVRFRIVRVMKSCCLGELLRVEVPSSERTVPDCPDFGRCGGCSFQHLTYEEELRAKGRRIQDALTRLGGACAEVEAVLGAADPWRYRNKSQYPVSPDGAVGFYRAGSHQVVPVRDCLIQRSVSGAAARAVEAWMRRYGVSAYDERTGRGLVRHIYVRVNRRGESLCCVVANGKRLPREPELAAMVRSAVPDAAGVVLNVNTRPGNVVLGEGYRVLWGRDYLTDTLLGLEFRLSIPSFYQVNPVQTEVLYNKALEYAGLTGGETVLDLYCGIGTITLCLAGHAGRVIGAEVVPEAVRDARENAVRNGIANAEFFCADAADAAARLKAEGLRPDVVTVDPPRKGLAPEVIASIAGMGPEKVVYVSCDPATLGRDVKRFGEMGYQAAKACGVDMFPRTKHVETVVQLSKGEIDSRKVRVEFSLEDMDMSGFQKGATYGEIKAYVLEKYGLKVSSLYISQVKRKCGLEVGDSHNQSKSENAKVPACPAEKERAIRAALEHFRMI